MGLLSFQRKRCLAPTFPLRPGRRLSCRNSMGLGDMPEKTPRFQQFARAPRSADFHNQTETTTLLVCISF
jgi:hypothetical protein